jgi:hypothetical protein
VFASVGFGDLLFLIHGGSHPGQAGGRDAVAAAPLRECRSTPEPEVRDFLGAGTKGFQSERALSQHEMLTRCEVRVVGWFELDAR